MDLFCMRNRNTQLKMHSLKTDINAKYQEFKNIFKENSRRKGLFFLFSRSFKDIQGDWYFSRRFKDFKELWPPWSKSGLSRQKNLRFWIFPGVRVLIHTKWHLGEGFRKFSAKSNDKIWSYKRKTFKKWHFWPKWPFFDSFWP